VDGRPNRSNIAAFSNYFDVYCGRYLTFSRAKTTFNFFSLNVILHSGEKTWWTREFTKEYLPFVVSNSSLSTLEGILQKQGIYRVIRESFTFEICEKTLCLM